MSEENPAPWLETYSMPTVPAGERYARLTNLAESYKRQAWAEIASNHPALARLLKEPELNAARLMFDADLFVEASIVPMLPPEPLKGRKRGED